MSVEDRLARLALLTVLPIIVSDSINKPFVGKPTALLEDDSTVETDRANYPISITIDPAAFGSEALPILESSLARINSCLAQSEVIKNSDLVPVEVIGYMSQDYLLAQTDQFRGHTEFFGPDYFNLALSSVEGETYAVNLNRDKWPVPDDRVGYLMEHEMWHLVHSALGAPVSAQIPNWWFEGVAEFGARGCNLYEWGTNLVQYQDITPDVPNLRDLEGLLSVYDNFFDGSYDLALAGVTFLNQELRERDDMDGVLEIVIMLGQGYSFEQVLQATVDLSKEQFYQRFESWYKVNTQTADLND